MQETYKNAPITEAVLDIFVRIPSGVGLRELQGAREIVRETYPTEQQQFSFEMQITAGTNAADSGAKAQNKQLGYAFVSADGKQVFQARLNGFTHNRLAPYQDWRRFQQEAQRLWTVYEGIAKPEAVELIALQYINRIELPVGSRIEDYLKTYVEVAPELPQELEAYSMSIQVPVPKSGARIGIIESFAPATNSNTVPLILNVRASLNIGDTPPPSDLWASFEELRNAKNLAFESCITDRLREMIR